MVEKNQDPNPGAMSGNNRGVFTCVYRQGDGFLLGAELGIPGSDGSSPPFIGCYRDTVVWDLPSAALPHVGTPTLTP